MKFLFCGDIVGKSGRDAVKKYVPQLKKDLNLDFVIVNGENAAHGFGINSKICKELYEVGVDVITTGNHIWDQPSIYNDISNDKTLLRPINYPPNAKHPGNGHVIVENANGHKLLVINVMGQLFMEAMDNPFYAIEDILKNYTLGANINAILIDIHAEATSEKAAMGHYVDGRATLVVGTHTHIPTADYQILKGGTAYMTDAGMCGNYSYSVVGMDPSTPLKRFMKIARGDRLSPAEGEGTLCAVYVESDNTTGKATKIHPVRLGGSLEQITV
jgi:metallophosphoesterase (TIGR00282 family)